MCLANDVMSLFNVRFRICMSIDGLLLGKSTLLAGSGRGCVQALLIIKSFFFFFFFAGGHILF